MVFNDLNINKLLLILAKDSLPYQSSEEMEKIKDFKICFLDVLKNCFLILLQKTDTGLKQWLIRGKTRILENIF